MFLLLAKPRDKFLLLISLSKKILLSIHALILRVDSNRRRFTDSLTFDSRLPWNSKEAVIRDDGSTGHNTRISRASLGTGEGVSTVTGRVSRGTEWPENKTLMGMGFAGQLYSLLTDHAP